MISVIVPNCVFVSSLSPVQANPSLAKSGTAGMYGMVGKIPDKAIVSDFVVEFFNQMYKMKWLPYVQEADYRQDCP